MKNITFKLSHLIQQQHLSAFFSVCLFALATMPTLVFAEENAITEINYSSLPGDQVQIRISLENLASEPGSFTIDSPARIALDFPNTKINLPNRSINIGIGVARSIKTVEAGGLTRVVLNLSHMVTYQTHVEGNDVIITLGGTHKLATAKKSKHMGSQAINSSGSSVQNIDFRRGEKGEGRIILELSDPNTAVDLKTRGEQITLTVTNTSISDELERRLEVIDFGTQVKTIDAFNQNGN